MKTRGERARRGGGAGSMCRSILCGADDEWWWWRGGGRIVVDSRHREEWTPPLAHTGKNTMPKAEYFFTNVFFLPPRESFVRKEGGMGMGEWGIRTCIYTYIYMWDTIGVRVLSLFCCFFSLLVRVGPAGTLAFGCSVVVVHSRRSSLFCLFVWENTKVSEGGVDRKTVWSFCLSQGGGGGSSGPWHFEGPAS